MSVFHAISQFFPHAIDFVIKTHRIKRIFVAPLWKISNPPKVIGTINLDPHEKVLARCLRNLNFSAKHEICCRYHMDRKYVKSIYPVFGKNS